MDNQIHNAAGIRPEDQEHNAGAIPSDITINCEPEFKEYKYNEKVDMFSLVTLKAPFQTETDDTRAPIDLIFVIDRSGSMAGQKLNLVKKTLAFVLTQLTEKDRLGVVSYDSQVCLEFGLRNMTTENKQFASTKINNIKHRGCTNLCGGLMKGMCQMLDRETCNEVASVLLFTDGLANEGITNVNGIVAAMADPKRFDGPSSSQSRPQIIRPPPSNRVPQPQQAPRHQSWLGSLFGSNRQQATPSQPAPPLPARAPTQNMEIDEQAPIATLEKTSSDKDKKKTPEATVYTFGFGVDHDPEMLKQISDAGNGMYYFIEDEDKIGESFAHCLGGLMSTVAQGIQMSIQLAEGVHIKEVHTLRPFETINDKSIKINIGDLQSEEKRDIVLELTLDPVPQPYSVTPQHLLDVRADYFNVLTNDLRSEEGQLFVLRPEDVQTEIKENPSRDVGKQKARVHMARVMKRATEQADSEEYEGARGELSAMMQDLRKLDVATRKEDQSDSYYDDMYDDVAQCAEAMSSSSMYKSKGAKVNRNMVQQYGNQRSSNLDSKGFETGAKMKKRAAASSFLSKSSKK